MVPLDNGAMNQMNQMNQTNDGWWRWMLMAKSDEDGGSWQAGLSQGAICGVKDSAAGRWASPGDVFKITILLQMKWSRRRWRVNCLIDASVMQRVKVYGKRANIG
jgi:hypothetical protein